MLMLIAAGLAEGEIKLINSSKNNSIHKLLNGDNKINSNNIKKQNKIKLIKCSKLTKAGRENMQKV